MLGIYGCGGLGRELYDLAVRVNNAKSYWDKIVFVDDSYSNNMLNGIEILSFDRFGNLQGSKNIIIAVGEPKTRELLCKKVESCGIMLATLVDPTSLVSGSAQLNDGVIISEFCSVHSNAVIGRNTLVQPFCCIGHDIFIGNNSLLSTSVNIGGGSVIGDRVFLGMNCTILQNIEIGSDTIVGMGSVVYRNIVDGVTILGNPARETKSNENRKVF